MNALEHQIHYPLADALPTEGVAMEIAPGIKWVRMGLPFALNHINLWLLRDRQPNASGALVDGWTVVDCCIDSAGTRAQWEQIFLSSLEGLPILRVIVTHMHPDHIGLAHWLCERWQVLLWISATDYNVARTAAYDRNGFGGEASADFYVLHGMQDEAFLRHVRERVSYFPTLVPALPSSFRRLMDADVIDIGGKAWQCIGGYGHAPEHIALHCQELAILISGDMVLPRISTNISVHAAEPESNPLQLFLTSLLRYLALPPATLVLPSHGKPFQGLHERIQQLQDHHRDRLEEILEAAHEASLSAADVLPIMFKRTLDSHQMTFAMGEALAHLHWLWFDKQLQRELDGAGVHRFQLWQEDRLLSEQQRA
ncbi:glyoxylase-like metal-dependent hydrolase (beta-lactamase superfamily II) [Acidovorax sp. 69]|uniref:MBL fold metallo-hydrolase n=1 Tax=Acidovorax sp. 69 TaxID=2035202 RepID=UPI000C23228E|nr:MBL fold metallo-hydrolase [Acidovorax sp. 69]PJI96021.1 glyoxylase-like metal-dependent hydrolase (beta-lactamase superfamily II) [Acidovorax sp. 69]